MFDRDAEDTYTIQINGNGEWMQHAAGHSGGEKLHLAIKNAEYAQFLKTQAFDQIVEILDDAVRSGKITGFKFLDPGFNAKASLARTENRLLSFESMLRSIQNDYKNIKKISNKDKILYESFFGEKIPETAKGLIDNLGKGIQKCKEILFSKKRVYNNPITIYLPDNDLIDKSYIINLCDRLENVVKNIPAEKNCLSQSDLKTNFPHISYRKEKLDGEYVAIGSAPQKILTRLKEEGEQSDTYKHLNSKNKGIQQESLPGNETSETFSFSTMLISLPSLPSSFISCGFFSSQNKGEQERLVPQHTTSANLKK